MIEVDKSLLACAEFLRESAATTYDKNISNSIFDGINFDIAHDVITCSLITENSCGEIVRSAIDSGKFARRVADGRYGAEELLLRDIDPVLERQFVSLLFEHLAPLTWHFWRILPREFSPPFLIRYEAAGVNQLPEHHDFQSDVSLSLSLNDDFEGGELYFPRQDFRFLHRRSGRALIFPGKVTHLHSAQPVLSGTRFVLTAWMRHGTELIDGA